MDSPTAYLLCLNGEAVPVDDEAKQIVDASLAQKNITLDEVIVRQRAIRRGISPEDRDRYFDGGITGYDPETGTQVDNEEDWQ